MQSTTYDTQEEWLAGRHGKITGSRAGDITPKKNGEKKIGFYALLAEQLGAVDTDEDAMERGHRLEEEAISLFVEHTGKEVSIGNIIWSRDDDSRIAISPDGIVVNEPEAVEIKCLSSARHLEAYLGQKIPSDYDEQALQYFVVNDELKRVHFAFYDPRLPVASFFIITLERNDEAVAIALANQRQTLAEVDELAKKITKLCQK